LSSGHHKGGGGSGHLRQDKRVRGAGAAIQWLRGTRAAFESPAS
jgi:hypothetical protein